tara:strand:+ start:1144 stop:1881 length:738 start_codon:yes stop_codon:yes gene_type:complete
MSLRKIFFKTKVTYKIYLYYHLYFRHKGFLKKDRYSQWGEDKYINDFFKNKIKGVYLDIGCFHPFWWSNTCLLYQKGWEGINIDINSTAIDLFNIARPNDINLCTTIDEKKLELKYFFDHAFSPCNTLDENFKDYFKKSYYDKFKKECFINNEVKTIKSKSIDEILKIAKKYNKIDFLNIDVEGTDLKMLRQLIPNEVIKPELISIETHHADGSKSSNADTISEFLNSYDYMMYKRVGPTTLFNR